MFGNGCVRTFEKLVDQLALCLSHAYLFQCSYCGGLGGIKTHLKLTKPTLKLLEALVKGRIIKVELLRPCLMRL